MKIGKMKIVVVESQDFSKDALQLLSEIGTVILLDIEDVNSLQDYLKDADVLFVRLRFYISSKIIDSAPQLKYILTATTGLDHIDVDYFESKGGEVISLKGEYDFLSSIPSTAEHTWGLILALMRNTTKAFDDVKKGFWRRDLFKGNNLKGKKIGLLGLGRVGLQVANYAEAFGMEIGFYDNKNIEKAKCKSFNDPKSLFSWADIISIHIPLNFDNIHFVNKALLDHVKSNAVLINTSRGAVVDELYLCQRIEEKMIKGYASDVLENEINSKDNLENERLVMLVKENYNVILTPHIAGATYESMEMTEEFVVEKLYETMNGN
jgi:D-3-phosphoglycerate dehydrogenase